MEAKRKPNISQEEMVLNHMQKYGKITSLEAMEKYGIMRLASRISDLKAKGYEIEREIKQGVNRYGHKVNFAIYRLTEDDD